MIKEYKTIVTFTLVWLIDRYLFGGHYVFVQGVILYFVTDLWINER